MRDLSKLPADMVFSAAELATYLRTQTGPEWQENILRQAADRLEQLRNRRSIWATLSHEPEHIHRNGNVMLCLPVDFPPDFGVELEHGRIVLTVTEAARGALVDALRAGEGQEQEALWLEEERGCSPVALW